MLVDPPEPQRRSRRRTLFRQSATTTLAAAASATSGLGLDIVMAAVYGANSRTDAFFVAARLPIGVAMILITGASQALVPLISQWYATRGRRSAEQSTTSLLLIVSVVSTAVAAVVWAVAPILVGVLAPGFSPSTAALATNLLRILLPVVPLYALSELLRAVANARHSFALPASMNVVLNVITVAVILIGGADIYVLAWANVAGAGGRLLFMVVVAGCAGFRPHHAPGRLLGLRDPDAIAGLRLSGPSMTAAGLAPAVRIVEGAFASFLPSGSITILNYGYRLVLALAGSVFFRSIVSVVIPRQSKCAVRQDATAMGDLTANAVRLVLIIAFALTAILSTLGVPMALAVTRRSSFSGPDAIRLGIVVMILSLSLVGEGLQRVLLTPFFATLDVRTPLRNAVYGTGANMLLLLVLVPPFQGTYGALFGMAAAFALSEYVGPVHAWYRLRSHIGRPRIRLLSFLIRVLVPACAAALACSVLSVALNLRTPRPWTPILVGGTAMTGIGVFVAGLWVTMGKELGALRHRQRDRRAAEAHGSMAGDHAPADDAAPE